jgi:hypothetical protein
MPKKKPGSVHTASNGAKYRIQSNGAARFISGPTKGGKRKRPRKKKGGSAMVGGSASIGGSAGVGGSVSRRRRGINYHGTDTFN